MKKILLYISIALLSFSTWGCETNYLDINKNPYDVTELDVDKLLTGAEYMNRMAFNESANFLHDPLLNYTNHMTSRQWNNYPFASGLNVVYNSWNYCYLYGAKNADELVKVEEEYGPQYIVYSALGRLLKAHIFMHMVDLWGDIPYSEFNVRENFTPKLDKDVDIYNALFDLIDVARDSLSSKLDDDGENIIDGTFYPGSSDYFYKGDLEKWIKFANTLELKMLVQTRKAKGQINNWNGRLTALTTGPDFRENLLERGEDFQFPHGSTVTPDDRHFDYVLSYSSSGPYLSPSPYLYEHMKGYNQYNIPDNPFAGIEDPRIPYFWYNQMTATSNAQNPTDYRDGAFVTLVNASGSGYYSGNFSTTLSIPGIYPVGGKYDTGSGGAKSISSGTGRAPEKLLMAYSVPFMLGELVLAGELSGLNADDLLKEGIQESIVHINTVSQAAGTAPAISPTTASVVAFIDDVLAAYNSANADGKMRILMTQKWIANYYNPLEAYADMRRTGYPAPFVGINDKTAVSPYAHTVEPTPGPVTFSIGSLADWDRILPYPAPEIEANPNVPSSRPTTQYGQVFWDVQ